TTASGSSSTCSVTVTGSSATNSPYTLTAQYSNDATHKTSVGTATLTVSSGPTKLATSVNGGTNPTYGTAFSVVVEAQNASGTPTNVLSSTNVALSVKTGSGSLGGTVSGTINAGTSSVTISGLTYSKAENGVILTATQTNGNTLTAGDSAQFNVAPKAATWTTNPASKIYGASDPVGLTTGSGSGFLPADGVTASYSRASGEAVPGGPYHITAALGPVAVLSNYIITNAGADFTITAKAATWTTNSNSKIYGASEPVPLTTGSGSFLAADGVTATYSR